MSTSASSRDRDRGQILVIVAVGMVAIIAMVGLVLDGGSAWSQRRSQQNASDLASLAGANTYLLTRSEPAALSAALAVAAENGWDDAAADVAIDVSFDYTNGVAVTVEVTADHENAFGAIVNLRTFEVGTTATALSGIPDTAEGAAPMIFSVDAFDSNGNPHPQFANPNSPYGFGTVNNHAPDEAGDIAWTNYGSGNVNANQIKRLLSGEQVVTKTLEFGEYIGQHNNGFQATLFNNPAGPCDHPSGGSVHTCLAGKDVVVPVVDHNGLFQGWATFHVTHAVGGSAKKVYGYFVSPHMNQQLSIGGCSAESNSCPRYFGSWTLKLID
jgi:Flp pilus assembly protein TadG